MNIMLKDILWGVFSLIGVGFWCTLHVLLKNVKMMSAGS